MPCVRCRISEFPVGSKWWHALAVLALALGACSVAGGATTDEVTGEELPPAGVRPTFKNPYRLTKHKVPRVKPIWTRHGVRSAPPELPKSEGYGIPVYDHESSAWYATVQGCLVRLGTNGAKTVVLDNMSARDVDVRAKRGLAVSREPDDTIVLHQWAGREHQRKVLLSGPQFFNPRLSPDGSKVLVAESRAEGGHIWLVTRDGAPADLGQGHDASWHPDGEHVVFTRSTNDGHSILSSEIFLLSTKTREEVKLAHTEKPAALAPTISPDGKWIAYKDDKSKDAFIVELQASKGR